MGSCCRCLVPPWLSFAGPRLWHVQPNRLTPSSLVCGPSTLLGAARRLTLPPGFLPGCPRCLCPSPSFAETLPEESSFSLDSLLGASFLPLLLWLNGSAPPGSLSA